MRIKHTPKVYLICKPAIHEEGLAAFLEDNGLRWPTPTDGVSAAARLVESAGRDCFDDQTEILTDEGWKLFSELEVENPPVVLTLHPITGEAIWQKAEEVVAYPHYGHLAYAEGRDVSLAVTGNHRQWGRSAKTKDREFVATEDLVDGRQFLIQGHADAWKGRMPSVPLPGFHFSSELEVWSLAQLLTYYVTEGSLRESNGSGHGLAIYGTSHVLSVQLICRDLGLSNNVVTDTRNGVQRVNVGGGKAFTSSVRKQCGSGSANKRLPRWVLELPKENLAQIWSILVETDGHRYSTGREVLITTSATLAGQAQELLFKIGFQASVNFEASGINHPVWRVSRRLPRPIVLNKNVQVEPQPYEGMVYCVKTENGVIVVRRNGKMHVSANCYMSYGGKAGSKTNRAYLNNLLGIGRTRRPDDIAEDLKEALREAEETSQLDDAYADVWCNVMDFQDELREAIRAHNQPAHGSVLEHPCFTFKVVGAGRGFSHELVRHRVGVAYSQLSTRYCDFEREEEEGTWDPGFCVPPLAQLSEGAKMIVERSYEQSISAYKNVLRAVENDLQRNKEFLRNLEGKQPRERKRILRKAARGAARDVLPVGTEAIMTVSCNARAIWNMAYLRASEHAEGVIREVFVQMVRLSEQVFPELFNGVVYKTLWDGSTAVQLPRDKV